MGLYINILPSHYNLPISYAQNTDIRLIFMRQLLFPLRLIYTIYASAIFLAVMFVIFPFVIIASFFGKVRGGNIIYKLCHWWADVVLFCCGIFHRNIYEVPHNKKEQYVFVMNHISYMDIPIMMQAIRKQYFRVLGKYELSKVPVFGFIYKSAAVTVDRSSAENRAQSLIRLKAIIRKGISIIIYPEGTFNTTRKPLAEFYDGAFKIAIETQTPIKPVLLLDTYDRFNYKSFFSLTPGKSRAVYLAPISVDGLTLHDTAMLKEKVFKLMEERLVYYRGSWIGG